MLNSNLAQQHVVVIGDGSMLSESVTQILEQETDILVSSATYSGNPAFLNIAEWNLPEAILVCDSGLDNLTHTFDAISSQLLVVGLLIIVIRLSNNTIDVYANASYAEGKILSKPKHIVPMTQQALIHILKRNHD